jgi:hypothetical protein
MCFTCDKVTIDCCDSRQVRWGRVSSPPSPVRDRYYRPRYTSGTQSFHHQAQYVSGTQSVFSPPSPFKCLVFSHFTTKPVTCRVWKQSLHHQAQYVSGTESVSSPPSPLHVSYGCNQSFSPQKPSTCLVLCLLSGGLTTSPACPEVYHGQLCGWRIGKVKVQPRNGHESPQGE